MRGGAVATVLLALLASACTSSSPHGPGAAKPLAPSSVTTPTDAPDPPATTGASWATSPLDVRGTWTVVATYVRHTSDGTPGRIDVLEWRGGWQVAASVDLPPPGVLEHPDATRPSLVADLTGDDEPDFLLPIEAASTAPYVVVSNDGGVWRTVRFADDLILTEPDAPTGGVVVTTRNLCQPSCAAGHVERVAWTYSRTTGRFARSASTTCDPVPSGGVRCVDPTSLLATVRPLVAGPALWVTPSTAIRSGRPVTVSIVGFPPGAKAFVSQCATGGPTCGGQLAAQRSFVTDDAGAATFAFVADQPCAHCVVEATSGSGGVAVSAPISYAP